MGDVSNVSHVVMEMILVAPRYNALLEKTKLGLLKCSFFYVIRPAPSSAFVCSLMTLKLKVTAAISVEVTCQGTDWRIFNFIVREKCLRWPDNQTDGWMDRHIDRWRGLSNMGCPITDSSQAKVHWLLWRAATSLPVVWLWKVLKSQGICGSNCPWWGLQAVSRPLYDL